MANSYHQLYIHVVFAVKYREAMIEKSWESELFGVIGRLINETGCKTIIVNGIEDHVHCFFGLLPSVALSDVMQAAKAKSSKYINENCLTQHRFEWQEGYGAFSYSHSQIDKVYRYVSNQRKHHHKITFKEEYLGLLKKFNIQFEEKYLFEWIKE
jgi:putative transposase